MNGELPWTRGQSLGNVSKPFVKKILNTGGGGEMKLPNNGARLAKVSISMR